MTQPPNDELAEKCLLGSMLTSPKQIPKVIERVKASDYYQPKHVLIHAAIIDMFTRGDAIDAVTVGAELESRGESGRTGGATYLVDLIQTVPIAMNSEQYAELVVEKARLRRLAEVGVQLQQLAHADGYHSSEVYAKAESFIRSVDQPDSTGSSRFNEMF